MKIEKSTHIWPGLQIKIILARCPQVIEEHGNTEVGMVYSITDRPSRKSRKNGNHGVWISTENGPVFVWFFEWKPYEERKLKRTKSPMMVRTVQTVFKRTK